MNYLYIALRSDGMVKVGFSYDPEKRIKQLGSNTPEGRYRMTLVSKRKVPDEDVFGEATQAMNPTVKVYPKNTYPRVDSHFYPFFSELMKGGMMCNTNACRMETEFKNKFSQFRVRGEWYTSDCLPEMTAFLANHPMTVKRIQFMGTTNGGLRACYTYSAIQAAA